MKKYLLQSLLILFFSIIFINISFSQCSYVIDMQDSFGDGWNGASIDVSVNGTIVSNMTVVTGNAGIDSVLTYTNDIVDFTFNSGTYDSEITFQIFDPSGASLGSFGPNPTVGAFLSSTSNSTCATPSCFSPSNFISSNISTSSADIMWSSGSNPISYNIEYGNSGFVIGTGTSTISSTGSYSITGLSPSSAYDVYLQADCSSGGIVDTSAWSGPFTFSTSLQGAGNITCTSGYAGSAFVDDLELQGLWTGGFGTGTGNGFWNVNTAGTSSGLTGPVGAHSGVNYFYFESSVGGGNSAAITSSPIDLSTASGDAELSFWMHAYGSAIGTLDVGVGTSATGPFTTVFTSSGQQQTSSADPYINVGINIAGYIGQTIYVQFNYTRGTTGTSYQGDIAIDLVEVISCFNCPGPSNIQAFNTTGTTTDITWNPNGTESSWNVWYHPAGSGLGNLTAVSNDTLSLNNLNPITTYEFYVQANCSSDSSIIVGPYFFTTPCAALTPPQLQDFSAGFPPNVCWNEAADGDPGVGPLNLGTGSWINDGFANNGTNGAVKIYLYSTFQSDWILSPQYDLTSGGPYQVEFDFGVFDVNSPSPGQLGSDDRVELLISTDGGITWLPVSNWNSSYSTSPNGNHEIISLANYSGSIVQFGFWATDGSVDDPESIDVMIDNFELKMIPSCPQPLALNGFNISSDSATISWSPGGTESFWNIQWGSSGFAIGSGNMDTTSLTAYSIGGLNPSSAYDFYVQSVCSSGDTSFWSGPYSFSTSIQGPVGINCSAGSGNPGTVYIDDLESQAGWSGDFGTGTGYWDINSGGTSSSGTGPSGAHSGNSYFYFEASTGGLSTATIVSPLIDLSFAANDAELSFWLHAYGSTMGTLEVGVGSTPAGPFTTIFSSTGQIQTANADPYQNVGINIASYIGQQVYFGFTYTRGSSFYGDVAIDLIEVQSCLSCPAPSGITLNSLAADTVNVSWNSSPSDSSWLVYVIPSSSTIGNTTPILALNDTIDLLINPSTNYSIYVQGICVSGDTSILAGPLTFATPCTFSATPYFTNMDIGFPLCWAQSTTDVFDWTLNNGTTSSSLTGPSDDMSIGGNYLFTETSSPRTQGDSAILISPTIDLSNLTVPELRFFNHMYGATIGTLSVSISDNGGVNYNTVFSKSGNQGDQWNEELITLANYSGLVTLKVVGTVGSSFTGDMAIDNFEIREAPTCPQPFNLNAINLFSDSVDLTWSAGLNESEWYVYLVHDTSTLSNTSPMLVTNDTSTFAINPNSTYSFYVQGICGVGDTSLISGPYAFNTPCVSFVSFPYIEDFSSWPPTCWDLTGGSQTCVHYNNSAAQASYWSWSSGQTALMTSPVFDVSSLVSPELIFDWSHQFNTSYPNDALEILVSDDGGTTWNQIWYKAGVDLESNDGANTTTAGSFVSSGRINVSNFGSSVMIRFNFMSGYGPHCFIDNVEIKEAPMNDIGVALGQVPLASTGCDMDSSDVIATIQNFGFAPQTGFNIEYTLNGVPVVETVFDTLQGGSSLIYTFSNPIDLSADGLYDFSFTTSLAGDSDISNDSFGTLSFENFYTPFAPSTFNDTICFYDSSALLTASGPSGVVIDWFDSIGGVLIASGDTLITPYITTTTSFFAAYKDMNPGNMGPSDNTIGSGGGYNFYNEGVVFDVTNPITLDSVTVYPTDTGFIELNIGNVIGANLYTNLYHITDPITGNGAVKLPVGINIPPGFSYTMTAGNATTTGGIYRNTSGANYPYNFGSDAAIIGSTNGQNAFYFFFYNWDVSTVSCYSDHQEAVAFVDQCSNINEISIIDFNIIPNPNKGIFEIVFDHKIDPNTTITITDIRGKIILKDIISNYKKQVNLSNIEKGIYLVNINGNSIKAQKRIVIH